MIDNLDDTSIVDNGLSIILLRTNLLFPGHELEKEIKMVTLAEISQQEQRQITSRIKLMAIFMMTLNGRSQCQHVKYTSPWPTRHRY
jgi:hypothetical protein